MKEIRALTALRGIAAMAVVLQHFSATAQRVSAHAIPSLVPHGYVAVDLFFVLSGFIMAYTYAPSFAAHGISAMPGFLRKRVARIVPLNTLAVLLVVLAGSFSAQVLGRNIFTDSHSLAWDVPCNLLMLQGLGIGTNLNAPSWSISTEFAAYFLFPALLALTVWRGRRMAVAVVGLCFAILATVAIQHSRLGLDTQTIVGGLARCLTEFVIGLGTYRIIGDAAWARRLGGNMILASSIVLILGALLLRIDLLAAIGFPLLIAALAINRGWIASAIASPVPYFLGEISFSLYLLHNLFRPVLLEATRSLHPAPLSTPAALALALAGSLAVIPVAWLAYVAVERPGRGLVRGINRGEGVVAHAVSSRGIE